MLHSTGIYLHLQSSMDRLKPRDFMGGKNSVPNLQSSMDRLKLESQHLKSIKSKHLQSSMDRLKPQCVL